MNSTSSKSKNSSPIYILLAVIAMFGGLFIGYKMSGNLAPAKPPVINGTILPQGRLISAVGRQRKIGEKLKRSTRTCGKEKKCEIPVVGTGISALQKAVAGIHVPDVHTQVLAEDGQRALRLLAPQESVIDKNTCKLVADSLVDQNSHN